MCVLCSRVFICQCYISVWYNISLWFGGLEQWVCVGCKECGCVLWCLPECVVELCEAWQCYLNLVTYCMGVC